MKTFKKAFYLPLLFLMLLPPLSLFAANGDGGRDFERISHYIVRGDAVLIGNTVLCPKNADGSCQDDGTINNANADLKTITNSSADLNISVSGHEVIWAGLFWMGVAPEATTEAVAITNFDTTAAKIITVTTPDDVNHTAPWTTNSKFDTYTKQNGRWFLTYQAYTDITTIVTNGGEGTYKINDLYTTTGDTSNPDGNFGAWMMVVIYNNPDIYSTTKLRDISIFNGFRAILDGTGDPFSISGFYTPRDGDVYAKMSIFTAEGDDLFGGESLEIRPFNDPDTTNFTPIIYTGGSLTNVFVSGISLPSGYPGTLPRSPSLQYNYAIDLHTMEIGDNPSNPRAAQKLITNEETGVDIKINTINDSFYASTVIMSTEIYEPKFCYDYAYKQQGIYFTEENDGSKNPKLTDINSTIGSVIAGEAIETTMFIRNLVDSDIDVTGMTVNITDINTTQATYITDSTKLAKSGLLIPIEFTDATDLNVSTDVDGDYIRAIPVGDMSANDYFYVYYSVDPKNIIEPLNMPIKVEATYSLVINTGTTIPYTLNIGANVDICSASNFNYQPAQDIFNLVHNNYYPHSDGNSYYNIPTQVTSRVANVKAISLDPDNLDTLKGSSNYVGIEMIDTSAFHDVNASCSEMASSISPRVWVLFDNNSTSTDFSQTAIQNSAFVQNEITDLSVNPTDFYINAKQNAAYRISWNVDSNDSNIEFYKAPSGRVWLNDFPDRGGVCAVDMDNNTANTDNIQQFCGNAGYNGVDNASGLDAAEQAECLKCLYGINTRFVCSRDNFSIRPEAFMMHLDDQNQTNPTNPLTPPQRLTTNFTGVNQATANANIEDINITADYLYVLEINATNHVNNISSSGYTRSFNLATPNDKAEYLWEPRGLTSAQLAARNLACNDDANISLSLRFLNGKLDMNSSVNQVGEYRLHLLDTTWTAVDSNSTFMGHHTGSYFLSGLDCISGSTTQDTNSSVNNGCDINSTHINNEASLVYNDYNVTFHPYDINVTNTLTMGLDNRAVNIGVDFSNFVYMSNLNNIADRNMSVHLNTTIFPRGRHSNTSLSNFVTGCYAKPLDINITKSAPLNTSLVHRYVLYDINSTGDIINDNNISSFIPAGLPLNRDANLTTTDDFFQQDMNGVLTTRINLNFDRNQSVEANPEDINFSYITVTDPRTFFNAELKTNKTAEGNISINGTVGQNITHYYGRTAARKTRIVCDANPCVSGQNGEPDVLIYYEAYCYLVTNNNTCDRTLLPTLTGRYIQKVDSRWYVNLNHTDSGDGNLTATQEVAGFVTVPNITNLNIYTKNSAHSYNMGNGLPYEADMNSSVPRWLIYDEDNATATTNKHKVIFQSATTWTGEHETNTTTKTEKVRRVNRRTMW